MNYRNFYIAALIVIVLGGCADSQPAKERFNTNWQFTISEKSATEITDEEEWENVTLPHTPFIEERIMDGQWQGVCWYRKSFHIPASAKNQRMILHFEGAMNTSEYWINGIAVAKHSGGYLPIVFDFTEHAIFGKPNTILVRLDNQDNSITGPKPMRDLDFNMHGGLYRDVYFETKNPVHITNPHLADKVAGGGIFISYPHVSKDSAKVRIKTNILNQDDAATNIHLMHEIWSSDSLIQSEESELITIMKDTDADVSSNIVMMNPKLWSPLSPSLYTLKTKLVSDNRILDEQVRMFGIRRYNITSEGFYLNGEKMFLRGVNRHQEYPYVGYALSNNAQYRDAAKIKEAGFDYVRLSHYPHSNAFMDACDKLGIVVIDAILGWQYYSGEEAFEEHQYQAARNLIRRDRNHPSVIGWELSLNESQMTEAFIDKMVRIGHEEYPGDQCYVAGWMEYGYDIYLQARQHRLHHYEESAKPYIVSEYGDWEYYAMNAGLNQDSWSNLLQEDRSSRQLLHDGEIRLLQQATNIQEAHNDNFNTTAFADGYWVMFDYNRGYSRDLEASGIMTIDRLPKFAYYFFKSQRDAGSSPLYDSDAMVKIASWWTPQSSLSVRVFSNCDEVELFLNDQSLGKRKPDSNPITMNLSHPPFTFNPATFEAGELIALAYINGKLMVEDRVRTPGQIAGLQLEVDYSGVPAELDCNDLLFVRAKLVDENFTVVRNNDVEVSFQIQGDAEIINPEVILTEAGIATALVRIGKNPAPISIIASSNGWKSETQISTFGTINSNGIDE
jgi:beta-galactosidase